MKLTERAGPDAPDQTPADALWRWGRRGNWGTIQTGLVGMAITGSAWSFPRYWQADCNGQYIDMLPSVQGSLWHEPGRWNSVPSWPVRLPWRGDWTPGVGTDNGTIVIDSDGTAWEIQNLRRSNISDWIGWLFNGFGWRPSAWVCDQLHRRTDTCVLKETHEVRGAGRFAKSEGLLLADEVKAGVIAHALAMVGYNVAYGPGARAVNGARVEHPNTVQRAYTGLPAGNDPRTVPHGTRFRLDISDGAIEQWAIGRHKDAYKRGTARVVARCLRDYGWVQLETGDGDPQLESEGRLNSKVAAVWASVGMKSDADFVDLLNGLLTRERIRVCMSEG